VPDPGSARAGSQALPFAGSSDSPDTSLESFDLSSSGSADPGVGRWPMVQRPTRLRQAERPANWRRSGLVPRRPSGPANRRQSRSRASQTEWSEPQAESV